MPRPLIRNLLATIVVLGVLIALIGGAVFSAYTSVATNDGNQFTAGTIGLTDNDAGTALFAVAGFVPGDTYTKCLTVNYQSTGGVQSAVRLYGQSGGTGLVTYLDLQIRRGSSPPAASPGDCTGFTADPTDYDGDGAGVIYKGPLGSFGTNYATGTADPQPSWSNGDSAVYQITITVQNNNLAQGLSATQDFSFEAHNL